MEIPQETPCIATFISNKQKCHFFFYKIVEQEDRTSPMEEGGLVSVGGGDGGERG
jgi:hypothetical protein